MKTKNLITVVTVSVIGAATAFLVSKFVSKKEEKKPKTKDELLDELSELDVLNKDKTIISKFKDQCERAHEIIDELRKPSEQELTPEENGEN